MSLEPFAIRIEDDAILDLKQRLRNTRLSEDLGDGSGNRHGIDHQWFSSLLSYWAEEYDWRDAERTMNSFAHYRVIMDGRPIHFLRAKGVGDRAMPLVLTHGWPWTFWDWKDMIGPLNDPAAHGGNEGDAFDVIIPSLPGFAFSTPQSGREIGVRDWQALGSADA